MKIVAMAAGPTELYLATIQPVVGAGEPSGAALQAIQTGHEAHGNLTG